MKKTFVLFVLTAALLGFASCSFGPKSEVQESQVSFGLSNQTVAAFRSAVPATEEDNLYMIFRVCEEGNEIPLLENHSVTLSLESGLPEKQNVSLGNFEVGKKLKIEFVVVGERHNYSYFSGGTEEYFEVKEGANKVTLNARSSSVEKMKEALSETGSYTLSSDIRISEPVVLSINGETENSFNVLHIDCNGFTVFCDIEDPESSAIIFENKVNNGTLQIENGVFRSTSFDGEREGYSLAVKCIATKEGVPDSNIEIANTEFYDFTNGALLGKGEKDGESTYNVHFDLYKVWMERCGTENEEAFAVSATGAASVNIEKCEFYECGQTLHFEDHYAVIRETRIYDPVEMGENAKAWALYTRNGTTVIASYEDFEQVESISSFGVHNNLCFSELPVVYAGKDSNVVLCGAEIFGLGNENPVVFVDRENAVVAMLNEYIYEHKDLGRGLVERYSTGIGNRIWSIAEEEGTAMFLDADDEKTYRAGKLALNGKAEILGTIILKNNGDTKGLINMTGETDFSEGTRFDIALDCEVEIGMGYQIFQLSSDAGSGLVGGSIPVRDVKEEELQYFNLLENNGCDLVFAEYPGYDEETGTLLRLWYAQIIPEMTAVFD